jgi:hypothetical protein
MIALSSVLFLLLLQINNGLFNHFEWIVGVNWIYLPAGIRLLCVLLFRTPGAIGIGIGSWLAGTYLFNYGDPIYTLVVSFLSAFSPYIVYLALNNRHNLSTSLANLTPKLLLQCSFLFGITSACLHHVWFVFYNHIDASWQSLLVMAVGDFIGAILLLYFVKILLAMIRKLVFRHKPN